MLSGWYCDWKEDGELNGRRIEQPRADELGALPSLTALRMTVRKRNLKPDSPGPW